MKFSFSAFIAVVSLSFLPLLSSVSANELVQEEAASQYLKTYSLMTQIQNKNVQAVAEQKEIQAKLVASADRLNARVAEIRENDEYQLQNLQMATQTYRAEQKELKAKLLLLDAKIEASTNDIFRLKGELKRIESSLNDLSTGFALGKE